jgi:hypothetical protein
LVERNAKNRKQHRSTTAEIIFLHSLERNVIEPRPNGIESAKSMSWMDLRSNVEGFT